MSWFGACDVLVRMCGCKLFGALAHNTRTCHHVVCAQSDLPQNDRKRICHLQFASVAALRAGTETDAESSALDSVHGSEQLSALALIAGSQHWLLEHGLSTWLQRMSLSASSHCVALMMTGQQRRRRQTTMMTTTTKTMTMMTRMTTTMTTMTT